MRSIVERNTSLAAQENGLKREIFSSEGPETRKGIEFGVFDLSDYRLPQYPRLGVCCSIPQVLPHRH